MNGRYLFSGVKAGPGYYVEVTASTLPSGVTQSFPARIHQQPDDHLHPLGRAELHRRGRGLQALRDDSHLWGRGLGGRQQQRRARRGRDRPRRRHRPAPPGRQQQRRGGRRRAPLCTTTTAPDGSYLFTGATASGTEDYIVSVDPTQALLVGYTAHHPHEPQLPRCLRRRRLPERRLRLPGHRRDHLLHPGSRLAGCRRGRGLRCGGDRHRRGHDGAAERQPPGDRHDHDGGGRDVHVQRPRGRRRRLHDPDHRHVRASSINYFGTTSYAQARQRAESNLVGNLDRTAAPSYGFLASRSIGDTIFYDLNGNGVQDAGDNGIAGVVVSLYGDTNGNGAINAGEPLVGTVTTDANGQVPLLGALERQLRRERTDSLGLQLHRPGHGQRRRDGRDPEGAPDDRREHSRRRLRLPGHEPAHALGPSLERHEHQRAVRRQRRRDRGSHSWTFCRGRRSWPR